MKWALVIHVETEMGDCLGGILAAKLGLPSDRVVVVKNFADVRDQGMERYGLQECQLVVVSFSAPSDASQSPPVEGNRPGALAFFSDMRRKKADLPFVFLARLVDSSSSEMCAGLSNVSLLGINNIWLTLPQAVDELMSTGDRGVRKPPHEVDVDIVLRLGGACTWQMRGAGGSSLEDLKAFAITDHQLGDLIEESTLAAATKNPDLIRRVGRKMYETLFANNTNSNNLELTLRSNIHVEGGNYLEAARFRFHLDSDTNQLLVETLAKPLSARGTGEMQYWMLNSPIYRKYEGHGEREPLFKDRLSQTGPIDCLIIQGNTDHFSAPPPVGADFRAIKLAEKEVDWLESYWSDSKAEFRIGSVRVVRPATCQGPSYGKAVRKALSERKWHLIHYAGHSAIAGKRGYLVLGDGPDDVLDIDNFAQDARGAQFVFLNSCSSASGTFVARLVEKNIPAVAGYAWPLEDKHAMAFSRKFYQELFEGERSRRFLEYSFMRGKAYLFNEFSDQPAWAAPLLFMQTSQAYRA